MARTRKPAPADEAPIVVADEAPMVEAPIVVAEPVVEQVTPATIPDAARTVTQALEQGTGVPRSALANMTPEQRALLKTSRAS